MPHTRRPEHEARHPAHVTLKARSRSLRSQFVFPTVRGSILDSKKRWGERFRIVHFSVQTDHIHLIVEADERGILVEAVRGLAISIARRVNRLLSRKGRFWQDRWHGRDLLTPRAVRRAIVYVLGNGRKHGVHSGPGIDMFSSAPYFEGFEESCGVAIAVCAPRLIPRSLHPPNLSPVSVAETWLLRVAWRGFGLISISESPRSGASR
jgi:putative transposase